MTFIIRDADARDIQMITEIYRESVMNGTASYELDAPDEAEMRARFAAISGKGYPYIVVVDEEGTIFGYAYASAYRTRPAYNWLVEDSIYLAPAARGRGLGRALLDELLQRCQELGFRQMVAVIGGASQASIAVHRAAGFEICGTMKATGFKHGKWLDTVTMQIALGDGAETPPDLTVYPASMKP
jgi:L-amino acid N-acyltransferase YncA